MERFTYETKDILQRFYEETPIITPMNKEEFEKLPLSKEYIEHQKEKNLKKDNDK